LERLLEAPARIRNLGHVVYEADVGLAAAADDNVIETDLLQSCSPQKATPWTRDFDFVPVKIEHFSHEEYIGLL
jgi:hypothetical protein